MSEIEHVLKHRLTWHDFDKPMSGPFYAALFTDDQRAIYREWFSETADRHMFGEVSVAGLGMLAGLILGNNLTRVVQCGHFAGYSSLMLGWLLQRQGMGGRIASLDIDQMMTRYTSGWLKRGKLESTVFPIVADSADPWAAERSIETLGGRPQVVFIDSSHQYRHTLRELELWSSRIEPGGFIGLHDVSRFARSFDHHNAGGVREAVQEWLARHRNVQGILIDPQTVGVEGLYRDPCGFGLLHITQPTQQVSEPLSSQRMIGDPNFRHRESWSLGEGWTWSASGPTKAPGASSGLDTLSPVLAGQRYEITVTLADVKAGGVHPGAGASEIGPFFGEDGAHSCVIVAGSENASVGLLASSNFVGTVLRLEATHLAPAP